MRRSNESIRTDGYRKTRKVNQDAQFASTEPVGELSNLFVVADGMGGHQAGDFASRYLIEHMPEYIKESGENEPVAALRKDRGSQSGTLFPFL